MSALSILRKKVHYEVKVPRCGTCKHYSAKSQMRDSVPQKWLQLCKLHAFTIKHDSCCDAWVSKDGKEVVA